MGSFNTRSAYLRRMGRICDGMYQMTPGQIAGMNETELMTFISNLVSDLEAGGVIGATIKSYV